MKLNEQIKFVQENYKNISINDIINIKDNNAKTYIINYVNKMNNSTNYKNRNNCK